MQDFFGNLGKMQIIIRMKQIKKVLFPIYFQFLIRANLFIMINTKDYLEGKKFIKTWADLELNSKFKYRIYTEIYIYRVYIEYIL